MKKKPKVTNVAQAVVDRAIKLLSAIEAEYHIAFDGKVYGKPITKIPKKKKGRGPVVSKGITDYVKKFTLGLNVGDIRSIPIEHYKLTSVQSMAGSIGNRNYGSGNYMTSVKDKSTVEFIRIA